MNDPRKFPWLGGLAAAIVVALVLIAVVFNGTMHVINEFATVADTYAP